MADQPGEMSAEDRLRGTWASQDRYNEGVSMIQHRTQVEWMETFILGLMSECGELLKEMNWKKHRLNNIEDFGPNVSEELADLTKFILSMWQLMGATPDDMLDAIDRKGQTLTAQFHQEHVWEPEPGLPLIFLDLDGVVSDFVEGFRLWANNQNKPTLEWSKEEIWSMHMDIDNGWPTQEYKNLKMAFEKQGGYRGLPKTVFGLKVPQYLTEDMGVIVWTARPYPMLKRVWPDTMEWLVENDIHFDSLNFGHVGRVHHAAEMKKDHPVIAIEDNPLLAKRYLLSGIPVLLMSKPYNNIVDLDDHPNCRRIDYGVLEGNVIENMLEEFYPNRRKVRDD